MKAQDIKRDLRSLSGQLDNWGKYVKNPGMLQKIAVSEDADGNLKYLINDSEPLVFLNIDLDRHCLPLGIEKIPKDDISLEVKLITACTQRPSDGDDYDPIEALGVNIVVEAVFPENDDFGEANCSWHLDKGAPSTAGFSHPLYHMNFGGTNMTKRGTSYGSLLLLSAPRIMHPPMDIILSCDFIIRNFYEKKNHQKLTNNPSYIDLLNNAQERYWRPYSRALSSKWHETGNPENLSYKSLVGH